MPRIPVLRPSFMWVFSACALLLLGSVGPGDLAGQTAPCASDDHRAFDFWLGSWEVRTPDGRVAGYNTIERAMGGCVLHEQYETPRGYQGESFNIYDASRGVWHQTWTDNGGLLLLLEGGMAGDTMVLEGQTVGTDGEVSRQRISWSRVEGDPNRVRQHWERSSDGGATWSTAFDGLYVRQDGQPEGNVRDR